MNKSYKALLFVLALLVSAFAIQQWQVGSRSHGGAPIIVVTREVGSGTRGAFVDIMGITNEVGDDAITVEADTLNGTSGMMQTVAGNRYAIGYLSYGSLNDMVKAVTIDGVAITPQAVKDMHYPVARPFNLAWNNSQLDPIADDFLNFIFSSEGQAIVESLGYIGVGARPTQGQTYRQMQGVPLQPYTASSLSGQMTIVGSTSLTPVVEKLAEQYEHYNPHVKINITSNGSTAGLAAVMDGSAQLGMASRELTAKEQAQLDSAAIALDGIVIVVNPQLNVDNLTMEQVRNIYNGNITDWEQLNP